MEKEPQFILPSVSQAGELQPQDVAQGAWWCPPLCLALPCKPVQQSRARAPNKTALQLPYSKMGNTAQCRGKKFPFHITQKWPCLIVTFAKTGVLCIFRRNCTFSYRFGLVLATRTILWGCFSNPKSVSWDPWSKPVLCPLVRVGVSSL